MRKLLLYIAFFQFLAFSTQGQEIKFYRPIGDISQNSITSIAQDQKGFLWFGTKYGLNRYNGITFQDFLHHSNDSLSLSNSSIESLLVDREGNLWIGTFGGGINVYNVERENFVALHPLLKSTLKNELIYDIFEDLDGDIWIATEHSGVKVWNKKSKTFLKFHLGKNQKNSLPSNHVSKIEQDNQGIIWMGTWGSGICKFDKQKKVLTKLTEEGESNLNNNIVKHIHKGKQGKLWIGMHQGIQYLDIDKNNTITFKHLEFKNEQIKEQVNSFDIISILEDSNDRLWIGTENNGLLVYHLKTKEIEHFKYNPKDNYSIQNNSIWYLFEDRQETIWIGLFKNGINKVDPYEQKFNHISDGPESKLNLSYGLVSSFAEDRNGNLWVGTDGGGLNFIERGQSELILQNIIPKDLNGLISKEIVCMTYGDKDQLWIGTWGEGLFVKDKNNNFKSYLHNPNNSNSPSGNNLMSLLRDKDHNIWLATHRVGLDLFVPSKDRFYHFKPSQNNNSISGDKISSIVQDQNGKFWIGMEGDGIDRFEINENKEIINLKNFKNAQEDKSRLSSNIINNLYVDSKNRIWVATEGGGINIFNNKNEDDKFKIIKKEDGLPSDVIYGILEETPDVFWISTNVGLATINLETNEIKTFDLEDGLQAKEFNKTASFKTSDSTFLFGGINGFNYFKPKDIQINLSIPPVFITNIEIQNDERNLEFQKDLKNQLLSKNIVLESDANDLKISFAALNYSQATKNQYSYKLENHDTYWRGGKNITSASYSNIPPGNYIFKVRASNNDQVWNETPITLNIRIKNPWYKSWWACSFYFLSILSLLLFINRTLIQRERLKNELKVEQYETERMQALSKTRSQFFANISHEFKTPLTLIISPLKAMQKKLEKIENKNQVNVMLRNAERLLRLIDQILDLSKIESGITELKTSQFDIVEFTENMASNFLPYSEEQFITFQLDLPNQPIPLYFEKDKMEKILINLLSNAFKYTPEKGTIKLTVAAEEEHLIISIKDTGIGIYSDQIDRIFNRYYQASNHGENIRNGTGIGLSLTKQLVELHGGKIEVTSKKGEGTQFDVKFLLGKSHLKPSQIDSKHLPYMISEDTKFELKEFNISPSESADTTLIDKTDYPLILIVEDNSELRAFTKTCLQANYRIIEAENGQQGFEVAQQNIPDLIITDLRMPLMNGLELCEQIRNDEKTSHILIIMLTVKSSQESKEMGFEHGADYYLTKPFNPKLLELRIKNILSSRNKFKSQIISKIQKASSDLVEAPTSIDPKVSSKDQLFMEKIEEIISQNIENSDFSIEDLCREMGFSKSQLYRKMKGLFGQSANEFIRTIRLKRAAELMKTKQEMSISEITYKVGFNDLQYFRSCFKKQYGITPSDFIKKKINYSS